MSDPVAEDSAALVNSSTGKNYIKNPDDEHLRWQMERLGYEHQAFDGAFHVSREGPGAKPLELEEIQEMADQQIDPRRTDEEAVLLRANAAKGCAQCPGHCCLAFTLRYWPKTEQEYLDYEGRLLELSCDTDLDRNHQMRELHALRFFQKNLIRLNRDDVYTCRAFDKKLKRCTAYEDRPHICKQFICGPAMLGDYPRTGKMLAERMTKAELKPLKSYAPFIPKAVGEHGLVVLEPTETQNVGGDGGGDARGPEFVDFGADI